MTCPSSIAFATVLFFMCHYYVFDDDSVQLKKTNLISFYIYLFGIILLMYRFERSPWRTLSKPISFLCDVASAIITLQLLINIWEMVEFTVIVKLPSMVNGVLSRFGWKLEVPDEFFIPFLYTISLVFLAYAHNSDRYLDYFLYKDDISNLSTLSMINSGRATMTQLRSGISGQRRECHSMRPEHINYRGPNTLPTTPIPLRRSARRRTNPSEASYS